MATIRKYRGRWVADFRDQNGRRRIERPEGTFESMEAEKRAARELLARRSTEVEAHTFTPSRSRIHFAGLCQMFFASKVKLRKPTLEGYVELANDYLLPYFGARKVETLTRLDVEKLRAEMAAGTPIICERARDARRAAMKEAEPKARLRSLRPGPRTTNKVLILLGGILRYAVRHSLASRNVAEQIEKLPVRGGEMRVIEQNVLSMGEMRSVLDHTVDPWRMPIAFAIYTGARQAEIIGLKWGDIDWNRRSAEIRRSWRRGAFYEPKTTASRRTVDLPDELIADLKRWRLRSVKSDLDLVFPDSSGQPLQGSDLLRTGLHSALRRAGIRQVRFHDLRHSFASNLLAAGVDVVTVSKALGHANVHVTLTTYAHAIPKLRAGTGDVLARLMNESGNNLETGGGKIVVAARSRAVIR